MKTFILMCKNTGKLVEGYRVCFFDKTDTRPILNDKYRIAVLKCDGWLLGNPAVGPLFWFFNEPGVAENFENLGEL